MSLNLTEVISQLQDIIKSGRFEYTPTNVESVRYENGPRYALVTFEGATDDETVTDMQRKIDRAERAADEALSEADDLRSDLRRAREEIARLKNLPT